MHDVPLWAALEIHDEVWPSVWGGSSETLSLRTAFEFIVGWALSIYTTNME